MYSVNPSGNSTLSCNAGSTALSPECPWIARRYRNWLEEFEFTQYWNLFFAPSLYARVDIQSSINHCETSSNLFLLHSSMMSLWWIPPSFLRGTVWSHRNNRVIALDTSKHFWSFDRCVSMSIHILSRTRIKIEVNFTAGFCLGLAFAMGVAEATSCSFVVGIDSVSYLSTPVKILTQETVLSWSRWNLNFGTVSIIMIANFCSRLGRFLSCFESILLHESPLHCEAACTLGISVASVVLLFQEYRSIVLVRQASNPHQNIVRIISGLLTIVRIFARILTLGFAVVVHWLGFFAIERSVRISIFSKWSGASGFPGALISLGTSSHWSAVAPWRSNSMFSWLPLRCIDFLPSSFAS